jgi:hypothetical protein
MWVGERERKPDDPGSNGEPRAPSMLNLFASRDHSRHSPGGGEEARLTRETKKAGQITGLSGCNPSLARSCLREGF